MDQTSDTHDDEEASRRRDEALRRALNTPPQPKPSRNPKEVKDASPATGGKRGQPAAGS
jgi:hypothetical protein